MPWTPPTKPIGGSGWKPPTAPIDTEKSQTDLALERVPQISQPQVKEEEKPKTWGQSLSDTWDRINAPTVRLMSPEARRINEEQGHPDKDDSVWGARLKGFASGVAEGTDDLVSSFTSPINQALTATGVGGMVSNKLLGFGRRAQKLASAGAVGHGLYKANTGETLGEKVGGGVEALAGVAGYKMSGKPQAKMKFTAPPEAPPKLLKAGQYDMPESGLSRSNAGVIDMVPSSKGKDIFAIEGDTPDLPQWTGNQAHIAELMAERNKPIDIPEVPVRSTAELPEFQPVVDSPEPIPPQNLVKPSAVSQFTDDITPKQKPIAGSDPRVTSVFDEDSVQQPSTQERQLHKQRETEMKTALEGKPRASKRMSLTSAFSKPEKPNPAYGSDWVPPTEPINAADALDAVDGPQGNTTSQVEPQVTATSKFGGTNNDITSLPPKAVQKLENELATAQGILKKAEKDRVPFLIRSAEERIKVISGKLDRARAKSKLLNDESGNITGLPQYLKEEADKLTSFPGKVREAIDKDGYIPTIGNTSRSIMSSVDLSPLRQAAPFVGKKEFWKNISPMIRMFADDEYYRANIQKIKDSPNYRFKVKNGLQFTDTDAVREEQFLSALAEEVPILGRMVKSSNRAFTGYLDLVRDQVSDDLLNATQGAGRNVAKDPLLAREIMNFVNTGTGRGSIGRFESSAKILNATLFSPRLMASRINLLRPDKYINADPFVRKEMLKSMGSMFTAATAMGTVANMLPGVDVSFNPTSSDFMKIKISNKTRIDIGGGFQQYMVLMARLIPEVAQTIDKSTGGHLGLQGGKTTSSATGKTRELGEGYRGDTGKDIFYNFMESKEAPLASFAMGLVSGKDFKGEDFKIAPEIIDRFTPMLLQDAAELAKEDPKSFWAIIPATFGASVQSYGPPKKKLDLGMGKPSLRLQ